MLRTGVRRWHSYSEMLVQQSEWRVGWASSAKPQTRQVSDYLVNAGDGLEVIARFQGSGNAFTTKARQHEEKFDVTTQDPRRAHQEGRAPGYL